MLWDDSNTEGFSKAEIDAANRIADRMMADGDEELEPYSISDALTNTYAAGITEAKWEAEARERLGL